MTLDKKLARLRKKEGLSQAEVSEKLDVSRQAVSRWESGEAKPSTENLQSLCKLYHVSLDYLLNESEDEPPAMAPADSIAERREGRDIQKKRKAWIRYLVIGVVALAFLGCCFFWYESSRRDNKLELHELQGEENTPTEVPEFDLDWE